MRERSCRRGHGFSSGTIPDVMPTEADARSEDHSDNSTQAAGSQLRCIHGGLRGSPISSETKMRAPPSMRCEHNPSYQPHRCSSWPVWNRSPLSNFRSRHCGSRSRWLNPGGIFPLSQPRFSPCPAQPDGVLPLCQPSFPPDPLNCRAAPSPLGCCAPEKFVFAALVGL